MVHFQIIPGYPIGWEWLNTITQQDMNWLIDILATTTDNTTVYELQSNRPALARFMDCDQGPISGYILYAEYLVAKVKGWTSEESFLEHLDQIGELINRSSWSQSHYQASLETEEENEVELL